MTLLVTVIAILAVLALLYLAADRTRVVAVCDVVRGKVTVRSGKLSVRVLGELRDVCQRAGVEQATLVVRKEQNRPALRVRGRVDERTQQMLRNVVGRFRLAQLLP